MDKSQVMSMKKCAVNSDFSIDVGNNNVNNAMNSMFDGVNHSCWGFWQNDYYPQIIRESYPVYLQERAQDKGKKAFEIIKILKDKKIIKLETVGDFIDAMDILIKIL